MSELEILDGRILSDEIKLNLRQQIVDDKLGPKLAVILVGNDEASHLYVKLKTRECEKIGIEVSTYFLDQKCSKEEVKESIAWLNKDKTIDAILVQLPLPEHIDEDEIIKFIDPSKDADGFHPDNLAKMYKNKSIVFPAPAQAVVRLITSSTNFRSNISAAVIANNDIFFKPINHLLKQYNITTNYYAPTDIDLVDEELRASDILVVAVGQPAIITSKHIKDNTIIIDVGTNKLGDKTIGDVDFESVADVAGSITPVPGGVGPMTIACLLENVINLHKASKK